jgi:hypothetical protein
MDQCEGWAAHGRDCAERQTERGGTREEENERLCQGLASFMSLRFNKGGHVKGPPL